MTFQPQPPPPGALELCQETVETQARTIRLLLSNYDALLRKVEHEDHPKIEVESGEVKSFAANEQIPKGMWFVVVAGQADVDNLEGGHTQAALDVGDVTYSSGTSRAHAGLKLAPLHFEIIWQPEQADG